MSCRSIQLLQLPIPQPGLEPAKGNVSLAAGYLKMYAQGRGLDQSYDIEIFPPHLSNTLSDCGLVEEILTRDPWMVGFTCYLWNIDRTLWIASRLKERRPDLRIIIGGPEVTADNAWVLQHPAIDFAAIGEGEQTFAELLTALRDQHIPREPIAGLYVSLGTLLGPLPAFRQPLASLDEISSPYLEGILDAADEDMLLLETIRGCIFKCKFCYYPKSYDDLYFVSREKIIANLQYARERGVKEVVLLDPTLNQARNFADFVKLLAEQNPDHQWRYFGELRAEGLTPDIARLLREANFTEVEIGLQSIDPLAMELMDRKNNMKAFERGVTALMDVGIDVKVDLIIGLPGDTPDSVRRGMHFLRDTGLYSSVQVFNLAILPGTAFRQEAEMHGLQFQPRPPYYVLKTPTIDLATMYELMEEAEEIFDTEFDALPSPAERREPIAESRHPTFSEYAVHLDDIARDPLPLAAQRQGAFELRLQSADFRQHRDEACRLIRQLLDDNPHSTLRIVLEPTGDPASLKMSFLQAIRTACLKEPSYLDRFYSMQLGRPKGAKHIVIRLPWSARESVGLDWIDDVGQFASIVWTGEDIPSEVDMTEELEAHEFVLA
ncbi:MAG: B12-binding domain-containing radical SAM protein [Planctomycetaceae bacterium]|nr:B12-binding domain-containing radical SAM protein [Planctomycetaceae bacterium]